MIYGACGREKRREIARYLNITEEKDQRLFETTNLKKTNNRSTYHIRENSVERQFCPLIRSQSAWNRRGVCRRFLPGLTTPLFTSGLRATRARAACDSRFYEATRRDHVDDNWRPPPSSTIKLY